MHGIVVGSQPIFEYNVLYYGLAWYNVGMLHDKHVNPVHTKDTNIIGVFYDKHVNPVHTKDTNIIDASHATSCGRH